MRKTIRVLLAMAIAASGEVHAAGTVPLVLEAKVPLGQIDGRIDHLAFDVTRGRLYVAEFGNDSVGVIDVKTNALVQTVPGFHEPQGIAYVASTDTIYVANADNGTVQLIQASTFAPIGAIALGDDADNVRVDEAAHRVYVGFGRGALAVIDTDLRKLISSIKLPAHPESFQLESAGSRIFVNVPDAHALYVIDRTTNQPTTKWATGGWGGNFPLAIDESQRAILTVFRHPPKLGLLNAQDGKLIASVETCGDSDDVFVDAPGRRAYLICGEGFIDVFDLHAAMLARLARIRTQPGARTALWAPSLERLFLAVRATGTDPAAIWSFRAVDARLTGWAAPGVPAKATRPETQREDTTRSRRRGMYRPVKDWSASLSKGMSLDGPDDL